MCVNIEMHTCVCVHLIHIYVHILFSREMQLGSHAKWPPAAKLRLQLLLLSECIAPELNLNVLVSLALPGCLCVCVFVWLSVPACGRVQEQRAHRERATAKVSRNIEAPSHANNLN